MRGSVFFILFTSALRKINSKSCNFSLVCPHSLVNLYIKVCGKKLLFDSGIEIEKYDFSMQSCKKCVFIGKGNKSS